jgi:hypothetical protein
MSARTAIFPAILLTLMLSTGSAPGQDRAIVTELDPGVGIAVDLTPRVRLDFFAGSEKSEELAARKLKVSAGASFRAKPLLKGFLDDPDTDKQHILVIGTAYEYSRASESGVTTNEHRIILDGTGRYAFARKFLLNDRNRFEFRFINGSYSFRHRNRLMLERPIKVGKRKLTPYGAAEAFWDQRFGKWSQFKFTGGVQIPFIRRSSFDLFYERQHCVTCTDPHTNIVGLTFNLYLRRKK